MKIKLLKGSNEYKGKNKLISKTFDKLIAGKSKVSRYYNEDKSKAIDVITIVDEATNSVTISTVNLSDLAINSQGKEDYKVGIEFILVSDLKYECSLDVLIDCAFYAIENINFCKPQNVYPNVVQHYYPNFDMKHILLTYPFLWQDLNKVEYENQQIY